MDKLTVALFLLVFFVNSLTDLSPATLVVAAGVIGLVAKKIKGKL